MPYLLVLEGCKNQRNGLLSMHVQGIRRYMISTADRALRLATNFSKHNHVTIWRDDAWPLPLLESHPQQAAPILETQGYKGECDRCHAETTVWKDGYSEGCGDWEYCSQCWGRLASLNIVDEVGMVPC